MLKMNYSEAIKNSEATALMGNTNAWTETVMFNEKIYSHI